MLPQSQNLISNNHFTQKSLVGRASYGGLHVRGMGDRLSHNLAHDALGQFVTPNGPLTMLDSNEIFNTGCARLPKHLACSAAHHLLVFQPSDSAPFAVPPDAEGDGGVIYNGMDLSGGYGMQYLHNFIHHTLEIPGLHGRGGIYFVRSIVTPRTLPAFDSLLRCGLGRPSAGHLKHLPERAVQGRGPRAPRERRASHQRDAVK